MSSLGLGYQCSYAQHGPYTIQSAQVKTGGLQRDVSLTIFHEFSFGPRGSWRKASQT